MDKYDQLREKTKRIVVEAERMLRFGEFPNATACSPDCASCLSADARGNVDDKDFGAGFDSSEDICMLEARNKLAEKHNLQIR